MAAVEAYMIQHVVVSVDWNFDRVEVMSSYEMKGNECTALMVRTLVFFPVYCTSQSAIVLKKGVH